MARRAKPRIIESNTIRFRILVVLYERYYATNGDDFTGISTIVKKAGLQDVDIKSVRGEIRYLKEKNRIKYDPEDDKIPPKVAITVNGIDTTEEITDEMLDQIPRQLRNPPLNREVDKLEDATSQERTKKLFEFTKKYRDVAWLLPKVCKKIFRKL